MKNLLNILHYVIPYMGFAILNVTFNILSVLFSIVSFAFFIPVLQILFKTVPPSSEVESFSCIASFKEYFYTEIGNLISSKGDLQVLLYLSILIVLSYFFRNLFRYFAMYFLAPVRNGAVMDIRNELYKKILVLPLSYFSDERKGDLMARMISDVQEVEWSIMSSLEMLFREPIAILFYLTALFLINPYLTLFVILLLPFSAYLIGSIGKSLRKTSVKSQQQMGTLMSIIEETLSGLRIIKAYTVSEQSKKNFESQNSIYTRHQNKMYRKRDLASPLSEFLSSVVLVIVLWIGGKIVLDPSASLDAALFITYLGIFSQLITPVKSISKAAYNVQKGSASVDRIQQILNTSEIIEEKKNTKILKEFSFDIRFENVSFAYDKANVLSNVNLKIEKGKSIALVGPSGGGKSTLLDLLVRFYDTDKGEIKIDGINVRDLQIDNLRSLMGIVSQETILFNDTIKRNIVMGLDGVSNEEIIAAAKIANAHSFIQELENGYDTNIGDDGVKLSGGQRQRISIARAILRNPQILIFDEATSALDTESERLVQEAIKKLLKGRTSIIIAHRLSTIQYADEIIVINKGEIVERGKHDDLKIADGVYKKLYNLQSFA